MFDSQEYMLIGQFNWVWWESKMKSTWPIIFVIVFQFFSHVWLFTNPWSAACQVPLSFTISQSLLKFMSIELVMLYNNFKLCLCLQSFPASGSFPVSWLFASGGQSIVASASATVLPMNIQGWFPFRIDWLDLLAIQGTLKSLLQHHSSKASIVGCLAFLYGPTLTSIHDYWKNLSFDYRGWEVES